MIQHGIFKLPALLKELAKNRAEEAPKSPTPAPQKTAEEQSRWLTYDELKTLKGISYSRVHLKRLEDAVKFPKRVKTGARIYWLEHQIDEWKQKQADACEGKIAN